MNIKDKMKREAQERLHHNRNPLKDKDRKKLAAYLDGSLDRGEEKMMGLHISVCKACRDELASLRTTLELVKTDEIPHFAPLTWKVRETKNAPWWRWVLIPVAAAAAVLALIITGGDQLLGPQADREWVEVAGESLSVDEGYQLASMLMMSDEDLKWGLMEYSESMPGDIYSDVGDLNSEEQKALICLLEEMMGRSKGVSTKGVSI